MKKRILFVCLGNICRSPAAEAIFLSQIKSQGLEEQFVVDSAGTGAWHSGNKADSRMRKAALSRGINIKSRARKITINDLEKFDLILTMDNSNFEEVNRLSLDCIAKNKAEIHPILSFAKDIDLIEVPDPYYGGENGFEKVLDLLEDAIKGLLFRLKTTD